MDFGLTNDQQDIQRTARDLLGERAKPERVREHAESGTVDVELWHEIAERRAANMRRLWPTSEKVRFRIRSGHAGSLPPRTDSPRTAGHRDEIRLRGGGGRC